ncbi:alpha/beta hydrolase [Rhodobacteraceae bacterium NNCM2]|nr:alpha/beta hydrolase [Coraliihabitans acroporae]
MNTATEFFDFEGRSVAWQVAGEGPTLVLVHGTPFSSHVWHRVVPWLARRYRVHTFDLMGYGRSAKGGDVSLGVQSRVLRALFEHWDLDQPEVLAHDFGGATVLRGWILEGLRYRKLTLVDPVVLSPWGSPFVAHVRQHEAAFAGMPAYAHRALLAAYIRGASHRGLSDDVLEPYLTPWLGEVGLPAFYAQIAQMDSRFTEEIEQRLGEIDCPTTILWGERDEWLPFEQGERLARMIPGARLIPVPEAGHLVQEDAPEAILAALLDPVAEDQAAPPSPH